MWLAIRTSLLLLVIAGGFLLTGARARGAALDASTTCHATSLASRPAPGLSTLSRTWWYRNYVWMGVAGAFHGEGFVADPRGQKIGWYRQRRGRLAIYAKRLDGPAAPFSADVNRNYGTFGFQPSWLTFGAPGCWAITAVVGRQASRFVVSVAP
jgi:hypothetical protein